jgi:hypothetical protein
MKGDTVTVIILFVAIIVISLWILHRSSVKSYSPYTPSKYSAYEGYQNLEYSNANTHTAMDNEIDNVHVTQKCTNLSGWKGFGVFCTPNGGLDQIDIYSQAKGDTTCVGKSSGYHNSKGGLCLDEKMINLLKTRGANATGGYGQIGGGSA